MTPSRVRARRGEGDRLRDEILDAVGALLDETNDEAAVSIRAIADRVGVTPPSIYRHFADKDALLEAVCAPFFVALQEKVAGAVAECKTPLEAVVAGTRAYIELGVEHPERYRIVFMRPHHHPDGPVDRARFLAAADEPAFDGVSLAGSEAFAGLLAMVEGLLASVPTRRRPDGFTTAAALWAAMHGIVALRITKPDFPWPPIDEQLDALLWPWRRVLSAR